MFVIQRLRLCWWTKVWNDDDCDDIIDDDGDDDDDDGDDGDDEYLQEAGIQWSQEAAYTEASASKTKVSASFFPPTAPARVK